MPKDPFHLNLIWILLQVWVKFVVSGLCLIGGMVIGVLATVYGVPFWIPSLVLVPMVLSRRVYLSIFMLGIQIALLSEIIH